VALGLLTTDGHRLEWVRTAGYPQLVHDKFGDGIPLEEFTAATDAACRAAAVVGSPAEYQRRYPDNANIDDATRGRGLGELAPDIRRPSRSACSA
jgi:hypothetical protein